MISLLLGIIGILSIFIGLTIKGDILGKIAFPMIGIGMICIITSLIV